MPLHRGRTSARPCRWQTGAARSSRRSSTRRRPSPSPWPRPYLPPCSSPRPPRATCRLRTNPSSPASCRRSTRTRSRCRTRTARSRSRRRPSRRRCSTRAPMYTAQQQPMSPRRGFLPPPNGFGPGPSSIQLAQQQQQQQQGMAASPRGFTPSASMGNVNFNPGASTSFHRGLPPSTSLPLAPTPAPIGPPPRLAPGSGRRASLMCDPGPIGRPSPIARPAHAADNSGSGSGSASPARRSPSPKGVLGSAALLADDDEVVPVRRPGAGGVVGQSWGAPGAAGRGAPAPWGAPGSAPAFNGAIGGGRGQAPGALWGNAAMGGAPGQEWHPTAVAVSTRAPRTSATPVLRRRHRTLAGAESALNLIF
ncbi:hypothetical protein B0H16DRAFT_125969 [Mycena metata]|uniref:Uncharacterized protein n=1 Tax=Mycena metata TaxID=1033252 RepID=A0AAD7MY66_9AGAR|nr:hypothetical protein B0H16DRAFT_125969 [Mycena metata]